MNLIGPDISFYQDDPNTIAQIDFVQMRTQTPFVIVRAGQNTWIDSDFIFNWQAAKEARLYRGSYWFYDSRTDPKTQADLWLSAIGDDYPDCGLWMDFEETYGGAFGSETHMRQFAERVLDNSPATVEVGVYTGYYYWLERIPARVADGGVGSHCGLQSMARASLSFPRRSPIGYSGNIQTAGTARCTGWRVRR